jgi:hypothetical protein
MDQWESWINGKSDDGVDIHGVLSEKAALQTHV